MNPENPIAEDSLPVEVPLLSAYVPCYNSFDLMGPLLECVRALATEPRIEFIFVDDASSDETADKLDRFCTAFPNSRLLRSKKNCGPGRASNSAIEAANGLFVTRVDSDDRLRIDGVDSVLRELSELPPDQALTIARIAKVSPDGSERRFHPDQFFDADAGGVEVSDFLRSVWNREWIASACGVFARKTFLAAANIRFEELYTGEDYLWLLDCLFAAEDQTILMLPDVSYEYLVRGGSSSRPAKSQMIRQGERLLHVLEGLLKRQKRVEAMKVPADYVQRGLQLALHNAVRQLRKGGAPRRALCALDDYSDRVKLDSTLRKDALFARVGSLLKAKD